MAQISTLTRDQVEAQMEVLDRLAAVRLVADAMLTGTWDIDPDVVEGLTMLVGSARRWAKAAAI